MSDTRRRDFLGLSALWSLVAAMGVALAGVLRLPKPAVLPGPRRIFKLGDPAQFAVGSVVKMEAENLRSALGYPDEGRRQLLLAISPSTPELDELRSLYVSLFEAGLPHPLCPLLESHYVANRPAGEVVLGNKLFYKHFGLQVESKAAPDHLLMQLEFLSWLEHCIAAGNPERESLEKAREEFLDRHVNHWIPRAAALARRAGASCYAEALEAVVASAGESQTIAP
jgi:nitrate reductase assembly molybdenum cofactor insertion protein NarJ